MRVEINRDNRLYIRGNDKPLGCTVDSINENGEVVVTGYLPETRRLFVPSIVFKIVNKGDETVVYAKVLKVNWKSVDEVVALRADEAAATMLSAELLCEIYQCQFFEPLV
jgi:hypothetical protein